MPRTKTKPPSVQLSCRELQIYELLAAGRSPRLISQQLSISSSAMKAHMRRIRSKVSVIGEPLKISDYAKRSSALTLHEMRIVYFVAEGLGNKEIALRLNHSQHTTRAHLRKIFRKLDVSSRADAVNAVRRLQRETEGEFMVANLPVYRLA